MTDDALRTLIAEECAALRKRVAELEEECQASMVKIGNLRSDIERHVSITSEQANEIERLRSLTEWMPIETAPKDQPIQVFCEDGQQHVANWCQNIETGHEAWRYATFHAENGDYYSVLCKPTHWRLPLPPGGGRSVVSIEKIEPTPLSPSERLLREILAMSVDDESGGISDVIVIRTDNDGVQQMRSAQNEAHLPLLPAPSKEG